MTSIFNSLKDAIFEPENPVTKTQSTAPAQPVAQPVTLTPSNTTLTSFSSRPQLNQVNPEIKIKLDQAVAEADQASYTEFMNYLDAMSSALSGSDEATHYRAALAAAAKKGFSPQEIAKGIDVILQVLKDEERRFNEAASQRISERVGTRENELAEIERQISDNLQKISTLQATNNSLASRKKVANDEIRTEKERVGQKKSEFVDTVAAEANRYQQEQQRILFYSGRGV